MKKQILPLIAAITLLSSCSHYYYAPNTHNVPVFKEKGEARLSGSITTGEMRAGDIQAGYAVTNHFALIANASLTQPLTNTTLDGRGHLYELGAGYFKPLNINTERAKNLLVFEIYGVAGLGGYRNFYWDTTGQTSPSQSYTNGSWVDNPEEFKYPNNYITTSFVKVYLQPSISFSHDYVDLIVSTKIGFLSTYNVSSTLPAWALLPTYSPNYYDGTPGNDWTTLNDNRGAFIFEPAFTLRFGYQYVKVQLQYSFCVPTNPFLKNLGYPLTGSAGISVDIAHRFFKKKPNNTLPGPETKGN